VRQTVGGVAWQEVRQAVGSTGNPARNSPPPLQSAEAAWGAPCSCLLRPNGARHHVCGPYDGLSTVSAPPVDMTLEQACS